MSTSWYGHRFVLQHIAIPRSNGGMRIVVEFDTGEPDDHWRLERYAPLLKMLEEARRNETDIAVTLAPAKRDMAKSAIDLGDFEIELELHGNPMRDEVAP